MEIKIGIIKEQFDDILQSLNAKAKYKLEYNYKENSFGGNPEISVEFEGVINDVPYKEKTFLWHMAAQTEQGFINEIKAYLFDVLDSISNL